MNEKKKNKGLIAVIIILIIALLGTSGYIIYDKVLIPKDQEKYQKKPKKEKETPPEESRTLQNQEIEKLLEQITAYSTYFADFYPLTEPLSNQKALYFALIELNAKTNDFMESDLEKVLEKYFGKNHPYHHEDIKCPIDNEALYIYNSAKRNYTYQDIHWHGGSTIFRPTVFFVDGKVLDEKTYAVKTNILYAPNSGDTTGPRDKYYSKVMFEDTTDNMVLGPYDSDHEITDEEYQSIKNKLPITTFTFEKDDFGNYGLKSVTLE